MHVLQNTSYLKTWININFIFVNNSFYFWKKNCIVRICDICLKLQGVLFICYSTEFYTDEREDLRSVPDVDIAKLVQSIDHQKKKKLSEVEKTTSTFKKIDEEDYFNLGLYETFRRR